MASCACEQYFGRLRWLPCYSEGGPQDFVRVHDDEHSKLHHDLKLARHDAVMAESALRAHLASNSLAAVPAEGFDALVADSAAIIGRCRETLETLASLSSRAKALGVQS